MTSDLPWSIKTRQVEGRASEARELKKRGAKVHPNSGAGSIKRDGSDDDFLYEMKLAGKSHTLKSDDLFDLFREAARQGKTGRYVVTFDNGVTLEGEVHVK